MKKKYIAPEIDSVKLNTVSVMATSSIEQGSAGSGDVVAGSKEYAGSFLWDDTAEE